MSAVTIKDGIHWIGVQDPDLRVFDVVMETEYGTSYNSYILKTPKFTVLFETAKRKWMPTFLENMREVCNPEEIDYIVIDHTEPDHAGSLEDLLDIAPNAKVVASSVALNFLSNICNREIPSIAVDDNDEIKLDTCTLKFISVPFLHWPDSIYTYIPEKQTLVTCDSFGCHYADDKVCNDLIEGKFVDAYKYYFDMIMGPFKSHVRYALDRIKDLDFNTICPGHGPVLRKDLDFYLDLYAKWSEEPEPEKRDKPKVVGAYVSAYGYTEELAHKIKESILEEIDADIDLYDMVYADHDKVLAEMASADGILAGTPTINGDALPPVTNLLMGLNGILHGGKVAGAFGSYGWSGEGADMLTARFKVLRMNTLEPLKVVFKPGGSDLIKAKVYGKKFAKKLQEEWVKVGTSSDGKTYWKCTVCGEVFEGALPPLTCPVCGAGQEAFVEEVPEVINKVEDKELRVVIIGSGAAAISAAESIRKRNKLATIDIYSKETDNPYYRPFLTKNMDQKEEGKSFYLNEGHYYNEENINLYLGKSVTAIDKSLKEVTFDDKSLVKYDKLVLATGASCFVPPIRGIDYEGVLALREKSDRDKLYTQLDRVRAEKGTANVVVIGGGLLGLETAFSLSQHNCNVTVLEACPTILPRQMDADGAPLLIEAINNSAVKVKTGTFVEEIYGADKAEAVITRCGLKIDADLIIVSAGIRSNLDLAKNAGLTTKNGIIVNEFMQTDDENIYAAGDCAEVNGRVIGLWDAAVTQGKTAGMHICGDEQPYEQKTLGATLHAFDAKLFSIGDLGFHDDKKYETVMSRDDINKIYKKVYFCEGKVVGGVLFGNLALTNTLVTAVQKAITVEDAVDNKLI